jgi:hypothetical protein
MCEVIREVHSNNVHIEYLVIFESSSQIIVGAVHSNNVDVLEFSVLIFF